MRFDAGHMEHWVDAVWGAETDCGGSEDAGEPGCRFGTGGPKWG